MKSLLQKRLSLLLCTVLISMICYAQKNSLINTDFGTEAPINITSYIKPYREIKQQEINFKERFKDSNGYLNADTVHINMSALMRDLYAVAKEGIDTDKACENKACVTALRITYGMDGKKIKYLYQPLYLIKQNSTSNVFDTTKVNTFYSYNKTNKTFSPTSDISIVKKYKDQIRIKKIKGEKQTYEQYKEGEDARSIIFSFKELVTYYNGICGDPNSSCEDLKINNGASFYKNDASTGEEKIKHTIFFSHIDYKKKDNEKVLGISHTDGANLAHLCPPSCSELEYPKAK